VPAFRVKLGANDLNCVDVSLNPTHALTRPMTSAGGTNVTEDIYSVRQKVSPKVFCDFLSNR